MKDRALAEPYAAFYRANPHKSARRIKLESAVREEIETFLDRNRAALARLPPAFVYDRIRTNLAAKKLLEPLVSGAVERPPPASPFTLGLRLLSLLPAVALSPILVPILLVKERTDREWSPADGGHIERIPSLKELEDRVVQNQLTHMVVVKPGALRLYILKSVLHTIDVLAHGYFNQGELGTIATIHFARWVFLDEGRRLLFFSNYDGSWESYLGDFIDLAATGLTGVWSNTDGFPRTELLTGKGARDEERFKGWTRAHQVSTPFWYSAYPKLSVKNTLANAKIADGLVTPPRGDKALKEWLALL
jgi:hypothetical protein